MVPDMVYGNSLVPDIIVVLADIVIHPVLHGTSDNVVLDYQHVPRWQPKLWTSIWPLMAAVAMDINTSTMTASRPQINTWL